MLFCKTLFFAIDFANFCQKTGISPHDAAQIVSAAHNSKRAWEVNNDKREIQEATLLTQIAEKYGFAVSWPGLSPVLTKDGHDFFLPN